MPGTAEVQGRAVLPYGGFVEVPGDEKYGLGQVRELEATREARELEGRAGIPRELDGSPVSALDSHSQFPRLQQQSPPQPPPARPSTVMGLAAGRADPGGDLRRGGAGGEDHRVAALREKIEKVKEERKQMTLAKLQELEEMEAELENTIRGGRR
jgi:hypothetical protein